MGENIELGELQNTRSPILLEYPTGNKLLLIFPLDGDVMDQNSNQFDFCKKNKCIKCLSRVPKERESAISLVGNETESKNDFGFTDIDLFVVNVAIQKRLALVQQKRDN